MDIPSIPGVNLPLGTQTSKGGTDVNSRTDQLKCVWYRWNYNVATDTTAFKVDLPDFNLLSQASSYDISAHVRSFSYNKDMGNAAGAFSLILENSMDWTRFMHAGEWMTVYLSKDGDLPLPSVSKGPFSSVKQIVNDLTNNFGTSTVASQLPTGLKSNGFESDVNIPAPQIDLKGVASKLRGILLIERIAIRSSTGVDGEVDITYVITGKDLGICMEETDLWFNYWYQENSKFTAAVLGTTSLLSAKALDTYMDKCFSIFFAPQTIFNNSDVFLPNSFGDQFKQWLLPTKMLNDLGLDYDSEPYFGNLYNLTEFHPTPFQNIMTDPFAGLEGTAWDKLKSMSQPEFHELFHEIDNGVPKVIFRPIPWAINKTNYPTLAPYFPTMLDLMGGNLGTQVQQLGNALSSGISTLGKLGSTLMGGAGALLNFRKDNNFSLSSQDIYEFDIGPDFHNRYNHFLITPNNEAAYQSSLTSQLLNQKKFIDDFPFSNKNSIRRHGLRKRHFQISAFLPDQSSLQFSGVFSDKPNVEFLLEANQLQKDFWANNEDFWSGSLSIAGNSNTKLGKVVVLDSTVDGASNMLFYLENYTDTFTVDGNGVGVWTQQLGVSRGASIDSLKSGTDFQNKRSLRRVGSFVTQNTKGS